MLHVVKGGKVVKNYNFNIVAKASYDTEGNNAVIGGLVRVYIYTPVCICMIYVHSYLL